MTISAKIIADSITVSGKRITTFELEYPRWILAEQNTHRMFSRNSASSRAVPYKRGTEIIENNLATPVYWGKNKPGMKASEEIEDRYFAKVFWRRGFFAVKKITDQLHELGLHKQHINRLLEPWSHMKTVLTATEFDNYYHLRNHEDAQPEIKALAEAMLDASDRSQPIRLKPNEWHVPYFHDGYWIESLFEESIDTALMVSASCCAQVSYRRLDESPEKAQKIYDALIGSYPPHSSPFEHQATPMMFDKGTQLGNWEEGATHMDRDGYFWSGNFKGWIQHRQLIPNNVCSNYFREETNNENCPVLR